MTTMHTPHLSVGLPVFNGANFLAESIESVLRQDFADFELIVSDNGSTDETPEICRHYAAADPRIRVIRHEINRGGAWNFNHVFALGRAPFFKWQAHDDVCLPGFFRRCLDLLAAARPPVVIAYPRMELIDEHGRPLDHFLPESMETRRAQPHQRIAHVLRTMTMGRPQFGIIRTDALRRTRLYLPVIAADFVLLSELALLGEFWEVPETLFQRRIHSGCSTRANRGLDELQQWWDPSQRRYRRWLPPMLRLGLEFVRSTHRLPLPAHEKLLCDANALWVWYFRQLRNYGGRWRRRLFHGLRPQPA
ncbi:MAG TPA: glycosyltransferase family 2 protein [Opitutus sp.]|nr:glycosyltransferase family 2 protein [Opitutus sp.]